MNMLKFTYGTTVFLSSAMLMVLEITAGRIIAPYVGNSLYSWTSVIGVVLAGLSFGNWFGGRLADRNHGHATLGITLGIGALTSLLVLALLPVYGNLIRDQLLSLAWTSLLLVFGLFLVPAILLGIVSPLVTTLYLKIDESIGRSIGLLHALAATGSIFGTFAAGFLFIQWIGTRWTIILVSGVLIFLSLYWIIRIPHRASLLMCLLAVGFGVIAITDRMNGFIAPCDLESQYYCLRIIENNNQSDTQNTRSLVIDHLIHGTNDLDDPESLLTPYIHAMDTLIESRYSHSTPLRYFFMGGGAYTYPRALSARHVDNEIVVSEIDRAVTEIAQSDLGLNISDMTIHHDDSRYTLRSYDENRFEVLILDAFHDVGVPYHLLTQEFNGLVKTRIAKNGLYLINAVDQFPNGALIRALLKTLKMSFKHVGVWIERPSDTQDRLTYILSASDQPFKFNEIESKRGVFRVWYNITDFVEDQTQRHNAITLTDDYAPIERLISILFTSAKQI
ncbi:MAG: fused MFS/spermidine synthase [Gammaproteobacteria bacterium]|nr:fused MFS/spermidine synthase [Gammaproteobacteria bacterium]